MQCYCTPDFSWTTHEFRILGEASTFSTGCPYISAQQPHFRVQNEVYEIMVWCLHTGICAHIHTRCTHTPPPFLLPPNAIATFFAEYFPATFFSSSPSGGFFRPFLLFSLFLYSFLRVCTRRWRLCCRDRVRWL